MIKLPVMTHPLSSAWDQPSPDRMAIYDDIAIMDRSTLECLSEYSTSIPTGVYEGKMWKFRQGHNTPGGPVGPWYLCWYGSSEDPDKCSINRRPIRLIRNEK
jgi:hypothetical protein